MQRLWHKIRLNSLIAEVASAAVTANQIDINHAIIALKRSNNPVVRNFAMHMVRDHTSVIHQAITLAMKLGVTPKDNAVTESLLKRANMKSKMLKSKWGMDFNKAYLSNEIAYHKAVISAVKNMLIPQTKNDQLKNLLMKAAPVFVQHMEMAKKDLKKLNNMSSSMH